MVRWPARDLRRRAFTALAAWFSPARWAQDDMIIAVAALVLIVSVFLPWFQATVKFKLAPETGFLIHPPGTVSGLAPHGYLWAVFALAALQFAALAAYYHPGRRALRLPGYRWFLVIASGLIGVVVLASLAVRPGTWQGIHLGGPLYLVVGWSYGGIIALVAATGSLGAAIMAIRERSQRRRQQFESGYHD